MATGGTCLYNLQAAIYSKLTGDTTLMGLVTNRVYDDVPESTAFPFVEFGDTSDDADNTFSKNGRRATVSVDVWSRYRGNKEALSILDRIGLVLERVALTVTGYVHIATSQGRVGVTRQGDGITRRGTITFSVWVTQS